MTYQSDRLDAYLDSLSKEEYDGLIWYFNSEASGWYPPIREAIDRRENEKTH